MRKCTRKSCRKELPTKANSDKWQVRGFCGLDCMAGHGNDKAMAFRERAQATERRKARADRAAERKAYNAAKRARETTEDRYKKQVELTQPVFNKMIRLLDEGKPCISCGKSVCGFTFDAGHYHSVGSSETLRLDPRNCHLQGSSCNRTNHKANYKRRINTDHVNAGYQKGLVDRFGKCYLDWLDGPHPMRHYTAADIKDLRSMFAAECRRLESGKGPSRDWRHRHLIFWIEKRQQ